ncbi:glycosyl hydrolase, family 31 [synthetic Mycoplasma mycoides JCVI-syn1.0]|uniref:Alpha-xylosidase n=1 Tax=Mycoplasma mycoides subsp. capri TaxID=40477 RepID=A0AB38GDC4_MYCMC|nr:alpha-xylosidase [Mycoplasma mycoides]ADH22171.1 glycosyl hydrolase, family 31 [synthetic Mycoplasma mycoides JCVI-syn1.0]ACU78734.1 glycosyl hydrolase, family 31 [Mycoplasma mycoides subsp. capri str. GM12]ACU79565.1 glycosyl hydrolase, family 31 [Mycoplasma mycoides subsp. capri str. GM12]SRX58432.1 alpha-xylosidase [Mycoplasma mycoides subsp. capri]SRX60955.1 alpha-xylosidase [Mycoplasma mycoides subsp. capri]
MPKPNNITSEMLEYSFPIKQRIFDPKNEYWITTKVSDLWTNDNSLFIEITFSNLQKATFQIKLFESNIINLKLSQRSINRVFNEHLNSNLKSEKISYIKTDKEIIIDLKNNEKLIFNINPFVLKIIDSNNQIKTRTTLRTGYQFFEGFINPNLGIEIDQNKNQRFFMSFDIDNDEKFYGLGEKFRPLVKNGVESVIWNTDNSCVTNNDLAYNGLPLLYSTNNWGFLINTSCKTTFEIGSPTTDILSFKVDQDYLDLYLFSNNNLKELVSSYTLLTNRISKVPDIGYGVWLNRLYYHNYEELFEAINKVKELNYPLDVITLDPKWLKNRYTKSCNFEYNTDAFGDFKKLFDDVKANGLEMCFWINPYIQNDGLENSKFLFENDLLVKSKNGSYAHPWTGTETYQENNYIIDFTNPKAYNWYKEQIKKLFKLGLRFVKPDYGDGLPADAILYNGYNAKDFKQYFMYLYVKCCYEAGEEFFGTGRNVVVSRPGYIGTQKFVGKWSGDSITSFSDLKNHLQAGLSLSLAGEVIWGTDIGGFVQSSDFSLDLYNRWTQVGMLNTFSRYHALGQREPWRFDKNTLNNSIKWAKFKKTLLPEFKVWEFESITKGLPILRPMVLENQNNKIARLIDDQYYIGSNLLICPILKQNSTNRDVFLPDGSWYKLDDKSKVYQGNCLYNFDVEWDDILIFVKNNSAILRFDNGSYNFKNVKDQQIIIDIYGKIDNLEYQFEIDEIINKISIKNNQVEYLSKHKIIIKNN